ncbi:hypothetical protein Moror_16732, partial [Moniliophthora roreri MCA 2997]
PFFGVSLLKVGDVETLREESSRTPPYFLSTRTSWNRRQTYSDIRPRNDDLDI